MEITRNTSENYGKLLYYAINIDPTMFMDLKYLAVVKTKMTIITAKKINNFPNYRATNPVAIKEYRKSGMILDIYFDVSYISEPEARSRSGEYFFLRQESNTPIQEMPL